jgi:epoxyqueuosine reductase
MNLDCIQLAKDIKEWGKQLGFRDVGITDTELPQAEARLKAWLARQHHGTMHYMEKHGLKRSRPTLLEPWARSIVIVCLDYYTPYTSFISRYALGRDYHRLMRKRLTQLAARVEERIGPFRYRAFSDSAPVMEKPLAEKAGLGWIGKNTLLIHRQAGSWFFL